MSRQHMRMRVLQDIIKIRDALSDVPEENRLEVIAEALTALNDYRPKEERHLQSSCGCYDWDVSIDYRPHHERYPEMPKDKEPK